MASPASLAHGEPTQVSKSKIFVAQHLVFHVAAKASLATDKPVTIAKVTWLVRGKT